MGKEQDFLFNLSLVDRSEISDEKEQVPNSKGVGDFNLDLATKPKHINPLFRYPTMILVTKGDISDN